MQQRFFVLATFDYPAEALVLLSKLASEGIEAITKDENVLATDPMITRAIGGVKVMVHRSDSLRAINILQESTPELLHRHISLIACPKCHKRKVRAQADVESAVTKRQFVKALCLSLMPFIHARNYVCHACGHKFDLHG